MTFALPSLPLALRVWRRNVLVFSKAWKSGLLPQFFDPLFYLVALGFGLGTYVGTSVYGVSYKDFIAPGLCGSAVMWAATFETTYNVYIKMEEARLYDAVLSTPVEPEDLVTGELLWAGTRSVIYGSTFLVIVALFGLIDSPWAAVLPVFLFLGGLCFGALGLAFTTLIGRIDLYSYYFTLFITPMFLFGGIFFPYDKLPEWAQAIAWCTPLYHLVNIARDLAGGPELVPVLGNAAWLAVATALIFWIPAAAMKRRLVA